MQGMRTCVSPCYANDRNESECVYVSADNKLSLSVGHSTCIKLCMHTGQINLVVYTILRE